jgi:hypothetical protein
MLLKSYDVVRHRYSFTAGLVPFQTKRHKMSNEQTALKYTQVNDTKKEN